MSFADRMGAIANSANWLATWQRRYTFAVLATVIATLACYALVRAFGQFPPFLSFFPAIFAVAVLAGFWPGMATTILSLASVMFLFRDSLSMLGRGTFHQLAGFLIFALFGTALSFLATLYRKHDARLREFERVVEGLDEMIVVIDRDYRYLIANRAFLSYRGMAKQDVIGRHTFEVLDPEIFEASIKERLDEAFRGKVVQYSLRYPYPTRGERDLLISYFPMAGQHGIDRVACILQDVTEKKHAEEALRNSERRYRLLFEKNVAGVLIFTLDGEVLECNDAQAHILGYGSAQEVRGRLMTEIYFDLPEQQALLAEMKEVGAVSSREIRFRKKDGMPVWVLFNTVLLDGANGGSLLIQATALDISRRKLAEEAQREAEQALRDREAHFRILVEQASDGIFLADSQGRYLDVNSAGAEMLGYSRDEVLRLTIADIVAAEEVGRIAPEVARFAGSATVLSEWIFRRKDGSTFPGEVCGKQLPDGRLQGILRDISERKHAEEAMRRNEERFRLALKDSPITVFSQDQDLRYTWIYNPSLLRSEEIIGKTDEELMGVQKAERLIALKRMVLSTGVPSREEVTIELKGKKHALDLSLEPVFDEATDDKIIGIRGAAVDIARLREMADSLQEAKDKLVQEKSYLETEIQTELGFKAIIGQSPVLREALRKARVVAATDSTVLLLGETGTGKELVARSVHELSSRHDKTFVKLNCAAVPSGLLESELFGHEKGAFTSAVSQKVGRIELADKGTLFLDEIGELPLELQPKLLRVLQDHEFERLGGVHTLRVDVRIIAATNRDLPHDIADKKFREDLFYRLNVFPIELPPLRDRREDIPMLVHYFVQKHAQRMGKAISVVPHETMCVLERWNWPGNIRELENMIERMVILTKDNILAPPPAELHFPQELAEDNLTEMEREHIIRVLRETGGVLAGSDGAASRLGLKRTTLQSMLKRFGIEACEYRRETGTFGRL